AILVRAVGLRLFTQVVDGITDFTDIGAGWCPWLFGIRSRSFDDFLLDACCKGIRQAVILASGLDCRAYRLDWPLTMSLYEVDQPTVIAWKQKVMASLDVTSRIQHHSVGIDLRQDWPTALQNAGFDETQPTVWILEGLLVGYLPSAAHDELLDAITVLSAPGSRITADHVDSSSPDAIRDN